MLNVSKIPQLLTEATEATEAAAALEVTLGEGGTVVETIVDGFTGMTTGFLDAIKTGFDKLVLNADGTRLSMLAIWCIVFFGIGMAPKAIRWIVGIFRSYKQSDHG